MLVETESKVHFGAKLSESYMQNRITPMANLLGGIHVPPALTALWQLWKALRQRDNVSAGGKTAKAGRVVVEEDGVERQRGSEKGSSDEQNRKAKTLGSGQKRVGLVAVATAKS